MYVSKPASDEGVQKDPPKDLYPEILYPDM